MSSRSMAELVDTLCQSSRRTFHNAYDYLTWPDSVDGESDWCMSPELCSLYGTDIWPLLSERAQKRLAFYESVNFFSLNIHGERALMQGLASRLYRPRSLEISAYLHHFLDEENKHSVLFGTFCERYARKVYPERKLVGTRIDENSPKGDFLFFGKVLLFEELVDRYNLIMSKDTRLHSVAVAINHNHHVEEARHLAFGRRICQDLWDELSQSLPEEELAEIREHLSAFLTVSWKEYYNPDVYADAGIERELAGRWSECNPWQLQRYAWSHPHSQAQRNTLSTRCTSFLTRIGATENLT